MAYILWRPDVGRTGDDYVTGWAAKGGGASFSKNEKNAFRYRTRAEAEHAIAERAPAGWQVREIADPVNAGPKLHIPGGRKLHT